MIDEIKEGSLKEALDRTAKVCKNKKRIYTNACQALDYVRECWYQAQSGHVEAFKNYNGIKKQYKKCRDDKGDE